MAVTRAWRYANCYYIMTETALLFPSSLLIHSQHNGITISVPRAWYSQCGHCTITFSSLKLKKSTICNFSSNWDFKKFAICMPMLIEIMVLLWLLLQSFLVPFISSNDDVTHAVIRLWKIVPFTSVRHILFHKGQYFCHKACNAAPYL